MLINEQSRATKKNFFLYFIYASFHLFIFLVVYHLRMLFFFCLSVDFEALEFHHSNKFLRMRHMSYAYAQHTDTRKRTLKQLKLAHTNHIKLWNNLRIQLAIQFV